MHVRSIIKQIIGLLLCQDMGMLWCLNFGDWLKVDATTFSILQEIAYYFVGDNISSHDMNCFFFLFPSHWSDPVHTLSSQRDHGRATFKAQTSSDRVVSVIHETFWPYGSVLLVRIWRCTPGVFTVKNIQGYKTEKARDFWCHDLSLRKHVCLISFCQFWKVAILSYLL